MNILNFYYKQDNFDEKNIVTKKNTNINIDALNPYRF